MATFSGNVTLSATYTVPEGEIHDFNPNVTTTVTTNKNFIVEGTLRMRPANVNVIHTLRFTDVDETIFVGGGLDPLETDVGLWIMRDATWDAIGTPKAGWNRTGDDPTWLSSDEMFRTPWNPGDFTTFAAHTKGTTPNSVIGPDGVTYTQECFNVTRNVRVEGTPPTGPVNAPVFHRPHVFIHAHHPQTIKYVALRYVGPTQGAWGSSTTILGRYALHHHHAFEGSRGSLYEGCVVRDYGSRAFVPHMSDGITQRDCIAFMGYNKDPFWWDKLQPTSDLLWEHNLVAGMRPEVAGKNNNTRAAGFNLNVSAFADSPDNNIIRDCAAAGINIGSDASGFFWPEFTPEASEHPDAVRVGGPTPTGNAKWEFIDNVAHNNAAHGIFVWQNTNDSGHLVEDSAFFRCGRSGIMHGAYINLYRYKDQTLFENEIDLEIRANSETNTPNDARITFLRFTGDGQVRGGHHVLVHDVPSKVYWSTFTRAEVAEPQVGSTSARYDFICTNLEPSDWTVHSMKPLSVYRVQRANGTAYAVLPDGSTPVIAQFAPYPIFLGDLEPSVMGSVNVERLTGGATLTPTGIVTGLTFGTLKVSGDVSPTGIASSLALGSPTADGGDPPVEEGERPPLRLRALESALRGP